MNEKKQTTKKRLYIENRPAPLECLQEYFDYITSGEQVVALLIKKTPKGFTIKSFDYLNTKKK